MKTYSISQLAQLFGLSRSTLLYYERIELFRPSERSTAGHRLYTAADHQELTRICTLRNTGLPLADIKTLLGNSPGPSVTILENRLQQMESEITSLRGQQHTIISLLKGLTSNSAGYDHVIDKKMWVNMLRAAGMDEPAMMKWHEEFETRSPAAHHDFLLSIGIPEEEALSIQLRSKVKEPAIPPQDKSASEET